MERPNEVILVNTYNHPTLAYRARKKILDGYNSVFPEKGQWNAIVVRDNSSGFLGPISGRMTYRHDLFMAYCPTAKGN